MIMRYSLLLASALLVACSDGNDSFSPAPDVAPSSLTVFPRAVPEGAPGEMSELRFIAAITSAQPESVFVSYETSAVSATAGVDYLDVSGEIEIPPGELQAEIVVEVLGDAEEELAETFDLSFTVTGNASVTAASTLGTISNDDTACDAPYVKADPNRWRVNGADPLSYAHRGGVIDFPENTLYAYSEVAVAGADVLEMDVYQTKDNHLIILHDLDVDRTTNGTGNVVDLTLAEIKALDAAYLVRPRCGYAP